MAKATIVFEDSDGGNIDVILTSETEMDAKYSKAQKFALQVMESVRIHINELKKKKAQKKKCVAKT